MRHYVEFLTPARTETDRISMTWPQHQRRECTFDGQVVKLPGHQRNIVALLLMRRGQIVSLNEIIEYIYPDPDLEPEFPDKCAYRSLLFLDRRVPGMIERVWGRGFTIPRSM